MAWFFVGIGIGLIIFIPIIESNIALYKWCDNCDRYSREKVGNFHVHYGLGVVTQCKRCGMKTNIEVDL